MSQEQVRSTLVKRNVIKIKHGETAPTINDLEEYELGYYNGSLYTQENNQIRQISSGGSGNNSSDAIDPLKKMIITVNDDNSVSMKNIFESKETEDIRIEIDTNGLPVRIVYNNYYETFIEWQLGENN